MIPGLGPTLDVAPARHVDEDEPTPPAALEVDVPVDVPVAAAPAADVAAAEGEGPGEREDEDPVEPLGAESRAAPVVIVNHRLTRRKEKRSALRRPRRAGRADG